MPPAMITVLLAHPYPDRSRANRLLARAVDDLPGVVLRSLYDLYPDFAIDADAERDALAASDVVVWQHPVLWYTAPALLKLWFEQVLTAGWAYGPGGNALRGKSCLWVVTTGGDDGDYSPDGVHGHLFDAFAAAVRQTARFCGMEWLEPLIVHAANRLDEEALHAWGERYRARLVEVGHA